MTGFEPYAVSPDGRRVVGRDYANGDIDILRMSDGSRIHRFVLGMDYDANPAWWESDNAVLIPI